MSDYFITVKSNLLEDKHVARMQVSNKTTALWMYMWFLDKITAVDAETQLGIVLGGKPLKISEMGISGNIKTRRKIFQTLLKNEYIITKRTPYGHIVYVTKAYKIFGQKSGRSVEKPGSSVQKSGRSLSQKEQNLVGLGTKSGRSNKTRQLDKTVATKEINNKEISDQPVDKLSPGYMEAKARIKWLRLKPGISFNEWYEVNKLNLTGG